MSVDGQILQTTYYGTSSGGGARYVEELFDAQDQIDLGNIAYQATSPTKDGNRMKKSNKKNIWVPGKPMTPKAREMLESGKGAMNADGRWTCLECNRSLSNEWTLEQHIQTVHGARTFSCDKCNKKFKRRDHLLNHEKTIHKGLKPCKRCNVTFNNREELRQHKLKVHYKALPDGTMPPIPRYLTQPIEDEPTVISPPIRSPPQPQSHSYELVAPVPHTVLQDVSQTQVGQTLMATNTPITTTQQIVIQALPTDQTSEMGQSFSQTITIPQVVQPNININHPIVQSSLPSLTPISRKEMKRIRGKKWRRSFGSSGQEDDLNNSALQDESKTHCDVFGCDKQFTNNDDFNSHWKLMHEENRCQLCKQLFGGSRSMKVHGSVHEPSKCNSINGDQNQNIAEGFKCWFCPGVFREKDTLLDHVDAFHVGCVCLECGSCLLGSEQCGDHIADQHPPQKVLEEDQDRCHYQCSACFHVFTKRIEAERHFVEQHFVAENEKVFQCCPYCPDVFQTYVRLDDHIRWEHGLEEIDENAVVMKNRESQQFFQCEICDHFFQTESILEQHIKRHQVEKVARYKVLPLSRSSPSKHKRKHLKKQKKKSEKNKIEHSDCAMSEVHSSKGPSNEINANENGAMGVGTAENKDIDEIFDQSRISNTTSKPPLDHDNVDTQIKCQNIDTTITDSLDTEQVNSLQNVSKFDKSLTSISREYTALAMDTSDISANPEIEQAVASISGTVLGEINHSLSLDTEGLETENSILPLTSGTLEIENAVNSILGETVLSNENETISNSMFDIKEDSVSASYISEDMLEQPENTNLVSSTDQRFLNGEIACSESNGPQRPQNVSENLNIEIAKNSQMGIQDNIEDKHNEVRISDKSSNIIHPQTQKHRIEKYSESDSNVSAVPDSMPQAQNNVSRQNLNGTAVDVQQTLNSTSSDAQSFMNPEPLLESPLIIDGSKHELYQPSRNIHKFDIPNSQYNAADDTLEKVSCPTNNFSLNGMMPVTQENDLKASNIININNGDVLNNQ